jgi:hypothetical protein
MAMNIEETPLGWEINMLFLMAHCCTILAEDIDMQIQLISGKADRFDPAKKRAIINYEKAIKEAEEWMFKFGLDKITYEAVGEHNKRYSNVIANSNALIRMMMLCLDRSHCDGGDARVLKRLRSMPENGIFPEKTIERFRMKLVEVPEVGDRVKTTNHGLGTLELHVGNENWSVKLDNGESRILNEKHFTLL